MKASRWIVGVAGMGVAFGVATAVLADGAAVPSMSAGASAPAAAPQPSSGTLAEGTAVTVKLARDTYSNNVGQGDPVMFNVVGPVLTTDGTNVVVIPDGAISMGRVISRSRDFNHGVSGKLTFTCEYALGVEHKRIYLRATPHSTGAQLTEIQAKHAGPADQTEKAIMRRAVGYPAGTEFTVYVDQDATFQLPLQPN